MRNLGLFERVQEGAIYLCIVVSLGRFLLSLQSSHQIVKFLNVYIDCVAGDFDSVEDFLLQAKFVLTSTSAVSLFKCKSDIISGVASLNEGFMLAWHGLG